MDKDDIISELTRIKLYNVSEYKRKLAVLRSKNPVLFSEVNEVLGEDPNKLPKVEVKTEPDNEENSNRVGLTVIGVAAIAIIVFGIVVFFAGNLNFNTNTAFNATQSLLLGYSLFNNLNQTYLQYSFQFNNSGVNITYNNGREYYSFNKGDYTGITVSAVYECSTPSNCLLLNPEKYVISQKEGNTLNYDATGDCAPLLMTDYHNFDSGLVLSKYDELYYFVSHGYVTDSYREGNWEFNGEACAPMYFTINPPSDFLPNGADFEMLRYEVCLNNYGVPLAIGRELEYDSHIDIFTAYLESSNADLLKNTVLNGQTLESWNVQTWNC